MSTAHLDHIPTTDEVEALRVAASRPDATNQDYFAWTSARDARDEALDDYYSDDHLEADYEGDEPDLDFMFECDSAFESIGWGDDDAYGGGDW